MNEVELQRMIVRLVGDGSSYFNMLNKAEKETLDAAASLDKFGKQVDGASSGLQRIAGILGSLGIAATMKGALDAFLNVERTTIRLTAAIEANGRAAGPVMAVYRQFAEGLSKTTLVTKGQTMALLQQAESFGLTDAAAQRAVKNSISLAAAKGGEAESFIRMTAMMEQGEFHRVGHILGIRHTTDETLLLAEVQKRLASGQKVAQAEMETTSGQLTKLRQTFAALTVEIGRQIAAGLAPLLGALKWASDGFKSWDDSVKSLIASVIGMVLLGPVVAGVVAGFAAIKWAAVGAFLVNPVTVWTAAIGLAAVGIQKLHSAVYNARKDVQELNDELARGAGLQEKHADRLRKEGAGVTVKIGQLIDEGGTPQAALPFAQEELKRAQKELDGLNDTLGANKKNLDEINTLWNKTFAPAEIKQAKSLVKEAEENTGLMKDRVDSLTEAIRKMMHPEEDQALLGDIKKLAAELKEADVTRDMTENQKKLRALEKRGADEKMLELARERMAHNENADETKALVKENTDFTEELLNQGRAFGLTADEAKLAKLEYEGLTTAETAFNRQLIQRSQARENFKAVTDKTDELRIQIVTLGKWGASWEAESLKMLKSMRGLKPEDLTAFKDLSKQLKVMQDSQAVIESVLTPEEQFSKRLTELDRLLKEGGLSWDIYQRAVGKAQQSLSGANKELQAIQGAAYGSLDSLSRVVDYARASVSIGGNVAVTQTVAVPTSPLADRMQTQNKLQETANVLLQNIRDRLPDNKNNPPVQIKPAGVGGNP